jgi:hypothetical protein
MIYKTAVQTHVKDFETAAGSENAPEAEPEALASCLPHLISSGCAFQKRIARRNSNLPPHRRTALR